jgi:hypothetical protein
MSAGSLGTSTWAPDNLHFSFLSEEKDKPTTLYVAKSDGTGLRTLEWNGVAAQGVLWSEDQKTVYINSDEGGGEGSIYQENAEGSAPQKVIDGCGYAFGVAPGGQYLITEVLGGDKNGIYEVSLPDKKCVRLLPGVLTFGMVIANDGNSFLYAVTSRKDVTILRQKWVGGKAIGEPQIALKLPFAFPLVSGGNAYDFSGDLATLVYARPSGHADLYLLRPE